MSADDKLDTLASTGMVDVETFSQILEMDDDDGEDSFSRSIVYGFFDQADSTFEKMDQALDEEDLRKLAELGHFLKGSSATLGLIRVRDSCEKIQNFGNLKDGSGTNDQEDKEACLLDLQTEIAIAKSAYEEVEVELRKFYES